MLIQQLRNNLKGFVVSTTATLLLSAAFTIHAEDDGWADAWVADSTGDIGVEETAEDAWDEDVSAWNTNVILDVGGGYFTEDNVVEKQRSLMETRLHLSANRYFNDWYVSSKLDLTADAISDKNQLDLRELIVSRNFQHASVVLGQQVLTWGTGDFVFLNDFFAKDWRAMLAGREDSYLKAPVAALKLSSFQSWFNIDWVVQPRFSPDRVIEGERLSYFNSAQGHFATSFAKVSEPDDESHHLRLFKTVKGHELALYAYEGFYNQPLSFDVAKGRLVYPELRSYGASWRSDLLSGVANVEVAYWQSRENTQGDKLSLPNSEFQYLVGYERELTKGLTFGLQYMVKRMEDFERYRTAFISANALAPTQLAGLKSKLYQLQTVRLRYTSESQKFVHGIFVFNGVSDEDYFFKLQSQYRHNDQWRLMLGVHVIDGETEGGQWGQFQLNDNVYAHVKYVF